jgi:hypothetical protein
VFLDRPTNAVIAIDSSMDLNVRLGVKGADKFCQLLSGDNEIEVAHDAAAVGVLYYV